MYGEVWGTVNVTGETGIKVGAGIGAKRMKAEGLWEKTNNCKWRFTVIIVHKVEKYVKGEMLDVSDNFNEIIILKDS